MGHKWTNCPTLDPSDDYDGPSRDDDDDDRDVGGLCQSGDDNDDDAGEPWYDSYDPADTTNFDR